MQGFLQQNNLFNKNNFQIAFLSVRNSVNNIMNIDELIKISSANLLQTEI